MTDDTAEAEKLLQQAKEQKRHETEPTTADDDEILLEEAVRDAYEQIESGDLPENLTIRDEHLAALFAGLGETGRLEDVGQAAADELDRDVDSLDARATVLKLLVRIGLNEIAPDTIDSAKEGRRQYLSSQADVF